MTPEMKSLLWDFLLIGVIVQHGVDSNSTRGLDREDLFPFPVYSWERPNTSAEYWASVAHHHYYTVCPNITFLTHGTMKRQEDIIFCEEFQSGSVIFLHGLGSTGKKMKDAILMRKRNHKFRHIKMVFPTAPLIPFTPDNGNLRRAWFDKRSTNSVSPEDPTTLETGMEDVREIIRQEVAVGVPLDRIIIGGFSLGGAMALNVAYRGFAKGLGNLAGVFAISAYLHENSSLYEVLKEKKYKKLPPLYYSHGEKDNIVLHKWGRRTFDRLKTFGIQGEFDSHPKVEHKITKKGLDMLFEWFEHILPYSDLPPEYNDDFNTSPTPE